MLQHQVDLVLLRVRAVQGRATTLTRQARECHVRVAAVMFLAQVLDPEVSGEPAPTRSRVEGLGKVAVGLVPIPR